MTSNDFSHIKFTYRKDNILYKYKNRQYQIYCGDSTDVLIFLDYLVEFKLSNREKSKMIEEIISFIRIEEGVKPILYFNLDYKDSKLWESLMYNQIREIKGVEITSIDEGNRVFYKNLTESFKSGKGVHYISGYKIKNKRELDKYWDKIKEKDERKRNKKNK